jgi:hypothetical protein
LAAEWRGAGRQQEMDTRKGAKKLCTLSDMGDLGTHGQETAAGNKEERMNLREYSKTESLFKFCMFSSRSLFITVFIISINKSTHSLLVIQTDPFDWGQFHFTRIPD